LALALIAFATPAVAQDSNADVRAFAKAFDEAQLHGDRAALESMLAADFLFVGGTGRIGDRREFIAGFTAPGHKLEPFRIEDPLFLRVTGDVAIVGGEACIRGTDGGQPFAQHFRYSDTFAKRNGRWVAIYTQVTGLPADRSCVRNPG
jgi:ketosteroid isomerase-like protein